MTHHERLAILAELLGGEETHICDKCGEQHIVTKPQLITPEEALEILDPRKQK